MRCPERLAAGGLLALTLAALAAPGPLSADDRNTPEPRWKSRLEILGIFLSDEQSRVVRDHAVTVGAAGHALVFDFTDGGSLNLALDQGEVRINNRAVGRYPSGGALETTWRELVLQASRLQTPAVLSLIRNWEPEGLSREEAAYFSLLQDRAANLSAPALTTAPQVVEPAQSGGLTIDLSDLSDPEGLAPLLRSAASLRGPALRVTVPGGRVHAGPFGVGTGQVLQGPLLVLRGDAMIYGTVDGNIAAVQGDVVVHPGGVITGDVLTVSGLVRDLGGDIRGQIRTLGTPRAATPAVVAEPRISPLFRLARNAAGVAGAFLTLLLVGYGMVLFARPPLEVVSDTVLHSFSRSFVVGLLGQVLVLPTFGMLVVGLVLTVAGILLVPFAVIVFALLLVLAVLGGFLAIAHAMGETITRRQLALGAPIAAANSYRYVTLGLGGVAALWLAWVLFGWVPVAGTVVFATAILVTWMLATVGFGAALLSRAGFREHFAGRLLPAESLTDEYLWATPQFGVTAAKRPGKN